MSHEQPNQATLQHIVALIQANFAGRDDLYAAADALGSSTLSLICRRLAEDLASNAIELQQMALAAGIGEVDINDIGSGLQAELMETLGQREGDIAVLEEVEACEQLIEHEYDQAIEQSAGDVEDVLRRQRNNVHFGQSLVRELRSSNDQRGP